ncbi:hypothetical protein XI25_11585 [Paenibacillus sp. DMB20]|nr:hypothetical protein XI25_11585 [Paenibacillus sp. DMB20]
MCAGIYLYIFFKCRSMNGRTLFRHGPIMDAVHRMAWHETYRPYGIEMETSSQAKWLPQERIRPDWSKKKNVSCPFGYVLA